MKTKTQNQGLDEMIESLNALNKFCQGKSYILVTEPTIERSEDEKYLLIYYEILDLTHLPFNHVRRGYKVDFLERDTPFSHTYFKDYSKRELDFRCNVKVMPLHNSHLASDEHVGRANSVDEVVEELIERIKEDREEYLKRHYVSSHRIFLESPLDKEDGLKE